LLLTLDTSIAANYNSKSQIARRVTEKWGEDNLYCPACDSNRLTQSPNNTPAIDFVCPQCQQSFQLKSRATWSERKVADADYRKMMDAVLSDATPNLLIMQYSATWHVKRLLLVPAFFFAASAVEKRAPLGPNTKRAGWVGCNILLSSIAPEGKLHLVKDGLVSDASQIRQQYQALRPLSQFDVTKRGWTLDVLNVVSQFRGRPFELSEVYAYEAHFSALHPDNHRVRDKIRQQLQVLRDLNLLQFLGQGRYLLINNASTQS
jgi:type II restriction enzyme